jgi:WhiB family redox-sensing transcriptional regulator
VAAKKKLAERAPWMLSAGCRGMDPDLMHPDPDDTWANRRAVAVCEGCEVKLVCRAWAFEHKERQGVWGGLTENQRRGVLRRRARSRRMAG